MIRRICVTLTIALPMFGCRRSAGDTFAPDTPVRPALGPPSRFEPPPTYPRVAPADTISGDACVSPVRDPRDGFELRMVRSGLQQADYEVPAGRYGVRASELLRLDCNTGEVVGIVSR